MKWIRGKLDLPRLSRLAAATLFLFFLFSSLPHRVHHLFDPDLQNPCVAFALSKGCHLKLTPAIHLPVTQIAIEGIILSLEVWIPYLTPSPFSKRAPPLV